MGVWEILGALYVTIALAAMGKTLHEARHSGRVTFLGLCGGLLLCAAWFPTAIVLIVWQFFVEEPDD